MATSPVLDLFPPRVPIGYIDGAGGKRAPIMMAPEFSRALNSLFARVGSYSGLEPLPVGFVFISVDATNPATLLGYGTWSTFGAGRTLVGLDSADTDFDTILETGGAKTKAISAHAGTAVANHASHTHTYSDVVNHTHEVDVGSADEGTDAGADAYFAGTTNSVTATTGNPTGGVAQGTTDGPNAVLSHSVTQPNAHTDLNVVQPYVVVYFWRRTA